MRALPILLLALSSCDALTDLTHEDFPPGYTCELPSGCPTEAEVRAVQASRYRCCTGREASGFEDVWVRSRSNEMVACQPLAGGLVVWGFTPSGRMRTHDEILACVAHESCWGGCGQARTGGCWAACGCDSPETEVTASCS